MRSVRLFSGKALKNGLHRVAGLGHNTSAHCETRWTKLPFSLSTQLCEIRLLYFWQIFISSLTSLTVKQFIHVNTKGWARLLCINVKILSQMEANFSHKYEAFLVWETEEQIGLLRCKCQVGNESIIYFKSVTEPQLACHYWTVRLSSMYSQRVQILYTNENLGWP